MNPSDQATAYGILYTDQYQLTMAQLYFRAGLHERPAQAVGAPRTLRRLRATSTGEGVRAAA